MAAEAEHQKRPEPSREEEDGSKAKTLPRLRRLEIVRVAAAQAVVCLVALYGLAKSHAGRLRPAVDAVESLAACVVGPVYKLFRGIALAILVFLDRKVDAMVQELYRKLPPSLQAASSQAYATAQAVPEGAKKLIAEARRSGVAIAGYAVYVKVEPVAKNLYLHYGPAAGRLMVSTWRFAVRSAAHGAERYNMAVAGSRCLPSIPIKLIAKFFSDRGVEVTHAE